MSQERITKYSGGKPVIPRGEIQAAAAKLAAFEDVQTRGCKGCYRESVKKLSYICRECMSAKTDKWQKA